MDVVNHSRHPVFHFLDLRATKMAEADGLVAVAMRTRLEQAQRVPRQGRTHRRGRM
jgi:hypothetical protein